MPRVTRTGHCWAVVGAGRYGREARGRGGRLTARAGLAVVSERSGFMGMSRPRHRIDWRCVDMSAERRRAARSDDHDAAGARRASRRGPAGRFSLRELRLGGTSQSSLDGPSHGMGGLRVLLRPASPGTKRPGLVVAVVWRRIMVSSLQISLAGYSQEPQCRPGPPSAGREKINCRNPPK
jgi:hypothetical protein